MRRATDRFPWLRHEPPPRERPGRFWRAVAHAVLFVQVWFPVLAQAQAVVNVPPVPNFPERPIPVTPDFQRKPGLPVTPNLPAKPAPVTTPNWQIGAGLGPGGKTQAAGSVATGQVVPSAGEAQESTTIGNTIQRAQQPVTIQTMQPHPWGGNESDTFGPGGNPQVNVRDIIPGTAGDTILFDILNADPSQIKAAAKQQRANLNQMGCRETRFVLQPDYKGEFFAQAVAVITPMRVTLVPIPNTSPVRYSRDLSYSDEVWGQNVTLAFPTLGNDTDSWVVLRKATPTTPGFELHVTTHPFKLPNDGTYFTLTTNEPGWFYGLTGQFTTLGSIADKFRWQGTFVYNSGMAYVWGASYAVTRTYSGTAAPPGGCPPDPPGNPHDGVDFMQPANLGIYALFNQTRSSPLDAFRTMNDSAWKPHPPRYDPDVTAVVNSAESIDNLSNPAFNELFSGCSFSSELPGSTSTQIKKPDIYHCQNIRIQAFTPNGCDGDRLFNFALMASSHKLLSVQTYQRSPWPRPAPTCPSPYTLVGDWVDMNAGTHTFLCAHPAVPPTCNTGDTLTGSDPTTWTCVRPDTTTYIPVIPYQPPPYEPALPAWNYVDSPYAYSGPINHVLPMVGPSGGYTTPPDANGIIFQYTIWGIAASPTSVFPWNPVLAPGSGTVSVGGPSDAWTISASGTVNGSYEWGIYMDVYTVLINQLVFAQPGCDKYMPMVADGFCQPQMLGPPENRPDITCLIDKNVGGFMDLGSGVSPVSVTSGIAELLVPWGPDDTAINNDDPGGGAYRPLPDSCWKMHGGPMTCAFPSGAIPCYIDAQGREVCGATDPTGMAPNFGHPDFIDNCAIKPGPPSEPPLFLNTGCTIVNGPDKVCAPSALGIFSNVCYVFDVSYDCGKMVTLENPAGSTPPTVQQCGATPLRCLGTECHNPPSEVSPDFNEAIAAASTVEAMQHDLSCADGTEMTVDAAGNIPPGCIISIFPGKWYWCKEPIGHQIGLTPNCCDDSNEAAAGVDPMIYLKAIMVGMKIAKLPAVQTALAGIPGMTGFIESFQTMQTSIMGAAKSTLSYIPNQLTQIANTVTGVSGEATVAGYEAVVSQATPSVLTDIGKTVSMFEQKLLESAYNVLKDAFGEQIANMFITGGASTTTTITGPGGEATATVGGFSYGPILTWIGYAYLAYQVLQILGHIIYACEEQELRLGLERKVGNCHDVGGYCKKKLFLVGCVEWRNSSCCYKTPLSRIIQEQVRKQLYPYDKYGGFGEPKGPLCEGLSLQQIQAVDWSRVDLQEWVVMMQEAGLMAGNATEAETMYGQGANTYQTVLGLDPPPTPSPDFIARTQNNLGPKTTEVTTRRVDLATQQVCYTDPAKLPWYDTGRPAVAEDVVVGTGGTGAMGTCGENCIEITLGVNGYHSISGFGVVVDQNYTLDVKRPDLLQSAYITEATWDDHVQIVIGGNAVYTSPDFFVGGELGTTWCLTQGTVPPAGVCFYPTNVPPGGLPAPGLDVLSHFQTGGLVDTNVRVLTEGDGHGYAKLRLVYQPSMIQQAVDPADCITPPPRNYASGTPGSPAMSCSVVASPSAPYAFDTINLLAQCSPQATSYTWSSNALCSAPVGGASATAAGAAGGTTCTYTVNATDGTLSATASASVTFSILLPPGGGGGGAPIQPGAAPAGCSAIVSPTALPPAGGQVSLQSATCSTGAPLAYVYLARDGSPVSMPDTLPANTGATSITYTYMARMCAADGVSCSVVPAGLVTVAAPTVTNPGTCTGYNILTEFLIEGFTPTTAPLPFDQTRYVTSGFDGSTVAIATIVVPSGVTGGTAVSVYEYGGQATGRRVWLSKSMCDFSATAAPYYGSSTSVKLPIYVGYTNPDPGYYALMQPGETWYVMVKNESVGAFGVTNTCRTGTCEIAIKMY
jgi:hypothetical protein